MEGCAEYTSAATLHSAIKNNARDRVKREANERKRSILYLIAAYLQEQNLNNAAECLHSEAQLSSDIEVCDNIDLDTILQEYQSYYYAKFSKAPKITKTTKHQTRTPPTNKESAKRRSNLTLANNATTGKQEVAENFHFEIKKLLSNDEAVSNCEIEATGLLNKPLSDFRGYSNEWREIAEIVLKEIVPPNLRIAWTDCVGLDSTVELLKEAVVYPLIYPELFSGLITPWKGVLLYGPPGTGKTLLSKAVACETKTTFFNMTSSCFINKWRGESEKMLKVLFDLARFYAPSTIFIDELDAFACDHAGYQHDASRRFKSELLTQLDGILREDDKVFVLATTNKPWDLDSAILRRFEKRIIVDLPCMDTRVELFKYFFAQNKNEFNCNEDFIRMGKMSRDFSGSDIKTACREACMRKLREALGKVEARKVKIEELKLMGPNMEDVVRAIESIRPVTNSKLQGKYLEWHDQFGCH